VSFSGNTLMQINARLQCS